MSQLNVHLEELKGFTVLQDRCSQLEAEIVRLKTELEESKAAFRAARNSAEAATRWAQELRCELYNKLADIQKLKDIAKNFHYLVFKGYVPFGKLNEAGRQLKELFE